MNAQELIDGAETSRTDFKAMFYPTLAEQEAADRNLSFCARSQ